MISRPRGAKEIGISLKFASPSGIPVIVMQSAIPVIRCSSASHHPNSRTQITFADCRACPRVGSADDCTAERPERVAGDSHRRNPKRDRHDQDEAHDQPRFYAAVLQQSLRSLNLQSVSGKGIGTRLGASEHHRRLAIACAGRFWVRGISSQSATRRLPCARLAGLAIRATCLLMGEQETKPRTAAAGRGRVGPGYVTLGGG